MSSNNHDASSMVFRETLSLNGSWQFALDPENSGTWHLPNAGMPIDTIHIPGSLEEQGKGNSSETHQIGTWTKQYTYEGSAWYIRQFHVPSSWNDQTLTLVIEGAHWKTEVWIDGTHVGTGDSLVAPHKFDVTTLLRTDVKHTLVIRVENRMKLALEQSHIHSQHTATNWNGITGGVRLEVKPSIAIANVRVKSDAKRGVVHFTTTFDGLHPQTTEKWIVEVEIDGPDSVGSNKMVAQIDPNVERLQSDPVELVFNFGEMARLWSDTNPTLHTAYVRLFNLSGQIDEVAVRFGLRTINVEGNAILLNGNHLFLRGYVDCCIFPQTGYPVWDIEHYRHQFRIAKSYGFNHVRLHGWIAPEPFWQAADEEGMIVQAELPHWSLFYRDSSIEAPIEVHSFLQRELEQIITMLNHYPSWVLLSMGNELISADGHPQLNELVQIARSLDPTRLYTDNTGFGEIPGLTREGDYFIPSLNWHPPYEPEFTATPNSMEDYRHVTSEEAKPLIAHEHGQYTMYADPEQAEKYTGVLRPTWLASWAETLAARGHADRINEFIEASGTNLTRTLKENLERIRRTPNLSGFQLLDIRDFPGQGHATTGILDMFWDSKGLVTPESFRRYNAESVLLMRSQRRTGYAGELWSIEIELSHYGVSQLTNGKLHWLVHDEESEIASGLVTIHAPVSAGEITPLCHIHFCPQSAIGRKVQLSVCFIADSIELSNDWSLWVYDRPSAKTDARNIWCGVPNWRPFLPNAQLSNKPQHDTQLMILEHMTRDALQYLLDGGSVWLLAKSGDLYDEVETRFIPPFWSYLWFPNQVGHTMGMLIHDHASLGNFSHDHFSDWQWYTLVDHAPALCLDSVPQITPIVEVVDNFTRGKRLAYAFEAQVGSGKLFVSSWNMSDFKDRQHPEVHALRQSILSYVLDDSFNPTVRLSVGELLGLFRLGPSSLFG